jgi:hypothetical protein
MAGRVRATLPLALVLAAASPRAAFPDDPMPAMADPPAMGEAAPPGGAKPLALVPDAEVAPLLDGLKKASKARAAADAMPGLDALEGKTHPALEEPLSKLLAHAVEDVAKRAAREMGLRAGAKTGAALWKAYALDANKNRPNVQGAILAALGATGTKLDAKQYDDVEKLWKKAPSNEALQGFARYFELVKTDKRPCRLLAEFLDEPRAGSVNDGANPPAAYWEARWKQWHAVKPSVVDALRAITGQIFDSTDDAKAWFKAHEREFGVRW